MSLMERLLKTLRYNFLTEALDFVGVHQERTLQVSSCLPPRAVGHCAFLSEVPLAAALQPFSICRARGWAQLSSETSGVQACHLSHSHCSVWGLRGPAGPSLTSPLSPVPQCSQDGAESGLPGGG